MEHFGFKLLCFRPQLQGKRDFPDPNLTNYRSLSL